ncbi:unnamed protein product [Pedinophyceae sp. YPF-701]|nr:unnamed protein product [Pedinophyceae sp. YPF-701]
MAARGARPTQPARGAWRVRRCLFLLALSSVAGFVGMIVNHPSELHMGHTPGYVGLHSIGRYHPVGEAGAPARYEHGHAQFGPNKALEAEWEERRRAWIGREDVDPDEIERLGRRYAAKGEGLFLVPWTAGVPTWPFQKVLDQWNWEAGIIALSAPMEAEMYQRAMQHGLYMALKRVGFITLLVSSYQEFPGEVQNPHDSRFVLEDGAELTRTADAALHCFRAGSAEAAAMPEGVPRALISESDFVNFNRADSEGMLIPAKELSPEQAPHKEFDLIYYNGGTPWHDWIRNFTLAQPSLVRLANELDWKILMVGCGLDDDYIDALEEGKKGNIKPTNEFSVWREWVEALDKARFLFVPNVHDASPRMLTEALSLDVGLLINEHIIGGWKYIHADTAETFSDVNDVVDAATRLEAKALRGELRPRGWLKENFGWHLAAGRLRAFLELSIGPRRLAEARKVAFKKGLRPAMRPHTAAHRKLLLADDGAAGDDGMDPLREWLAGVGAGAPGEVREWVRGLVGG